jgi:hypothetical protein
MGLKSDFPRSEARPQLAVCTDLSHYFSIPLRNVRKVPRPPWKCPRFPATGSKKSSARAPCPPFIWRSRNRLGRRVAHQGAVPRSGRRSHLQQALHQGSPHHRQARPPAYRHHFRRRQSGRCVLHRDGISGGRHAQGADQGGADARPGGQHSVSDRPGAGLGAPAALHSSRHQAGQHPVPQSRHGGAIGFRHRQEYAGRTKPS